MAKAGVKSFQEALERDVDPPEELAHVVTWYKRLRKRNGRGWNFEPIPFSEIESFKNLTGVDLTPFDLDMLEMLDDIWQLKQPPPSK